MASSASLVTVDTPTTTIIQFKDGFIKDDWAKLCEPVQRTPFLWTGRKAEVGQRTETQIAATNGSWCRLSGVVTHVGEMPTLEEWRSGNSCQLPPGVKSETLSLDDQLSLRNEFINHFGTLHGQIVTSYSYLNFDFYHRQEVLPVKKGRVYKATHRADENMGCFWVVTQVEDVTDDIVSGEVVVPQVFKKWSEFHEYPSLP